MNVIAHGGEAATTPALPLVSVVIPARDAERFLPAQLRALAAQTYEGPWEVLVADNGSCDGTVDIVAAFAGQLPGLRLVEASTVRGPAHARNAGAAQARGEVLLFCDADDVVAPTWVAAMARATHFSPLVAGIGTHSVNPEVPPPMRDEGPDPDQFPFLAWNRSANLGIRRDVFLAVGGFDERRQIGEDVDFCWRVQLAGHRLSFVSDAHVHYRERTDLGALLRRYFTFGCAAHELYGAFREAGAPTPNLRWAMRDGLRLVYRSPRLLSGRNARRRWLTSAAGMAGRIWAVLRLPGRGT